MKINNRFMYGILSILLAVIIAFIAVPVVTGKTSSTREIVRMKAAVYRGSVITAEDVELVVVGGFNLPENIAVKTSDVIGAYAATDLLPGDYILSGKVSPGPLSSDQSLNEIPDGMVAISITTRTLASALSDKLQGGDIVRMYHYDDKNEFTPVSDILELRFVKVLSVTDSKGLDIDYTMPPAADEEKLQTATITVLASPEQAVLLTRYENEGILHVALISRGNEKLAADLLSRQAGILMQLYGDSLITDENLDSSFIAESEPQIGENNTVPAEDTEPERGEE